MLWWFWAFQKAREMKSSKTDISSLGAGTVVQIVRSAGAGSATLINTTGQRPQHRAIHVVASPAGTAPALKSAAVTGVGAAQSYGSPASTTRVITTSKPLAVTPIQRTYGGGISTRTYMSAPGAVKRTSYDDYNYSALRKYPRSTDKSKGLRHFSTKVCEKVKEKGRTSYNEVADELVQEYFDSVGLAPGDTFQEKQQYDMKNIRRRVYDALNVLMAMNIIEKEKKEIRWVGLPTSSLQECRRLEEEKDKRQERIKQKAEQLQELIIQLVAYKSLVARNREKERNEGRPPQNTLLYLPYIVVNTDKKTMIDCSISHDKTEYLFNFDHPFEIHDDIEVLKRLGLAHGLERAQVADEDVEKVKKCLPPALRDYVDQILQGRLAGGLMGPSVTVKPSSTSVAALNTRNVLNANPRSTVTRTIHQPPYRAAPQYRTYLQQSQGANTSGHEYSTGRSGNVRYAMVGKVGTNSGHTYTTQQQQDSPVYNNSSSGLAARPRTSGGRQVAYIVGSGMNRHVIGNIGSGYSTTIHTRYENVEYEEGDSVESNSNHGY